MSAAVPDGTCCRFSLNHFTHLQFGEFEKIIFSPSMQHDLSRRTGFGSGTNVYPPSFTQNQRFPELESSEDSK
jgi:hypothetical protein